MDLPLFFGPQIRVTGGGTEESAPETTEFAASAHSGGMITSRRGEQAIDEGREKNGGRVMRVAF